MCQKMNKKIKINCKKKNDWALDWTHDLRIKGRGTTHSADTANKCTMRYTYIPHLYAV